MAILELRILPPIAVGRLGASATPLEAFDLEVPADRPLDFRTIIPRESFIVDPESGTLSSYVPKNIRFRDGDQVRPVAPFLEVFAITDADPAKLVPLTLTLLSENGLDLNAVSWNVEVANIKVFRRTGSDADKIIASVRGINDHDSHDLLGQCPNFIDSKTLPLGSVRFIRPTDAHPGLRLRFTPATGKVYGSSIKRHISKTVEVMDPVITSKEQIIYDIKKGHWRGYRESGGPALTNPGQIFAGYSDSNSQVSWGYLDDECDGHVEVRLAAGRKVLTARAIIGAGPPAYAPDTLPIRVISDELEQLLLGPEVEGDVPIEEAEEIVRRALETVRLMNTAVMNGNPVNGRQNVASTMVRQDTGDFERLFEPIMAPSLVDNLAVVALHERVFNALSSGAAPWFSEVLRRPEEIGDLSNKARRKMPAMMRNADGRALTLTHRQINTVIRAAAAAMFAPTSPSPVAMPTALTPNNLTAQLHHRGAGNPYSVLPRTAISNCFPGLEFDFRNLWRRAFVGIVLLENNNYVIGAEDAKYKHLVGCRLVRVDGKSTTVATEGPVFPGGSTGTLATTSNPNAASFMEWSNLLAAVLQKTGQSVECEFTAKPSATEVIWSDKLPTVKVKLKVRALFEGKSAAIAADVLQPGELTQGLCAPWQNDYRECACYYWAASRPDYVNVEPGPDGLSHGDQWTSKKRTGNYIPDDRTDSRLVTYDDLFRDWQKELRFIIRGRDAEQS
eukprot:TRINITY_DN193_c2_g1_i2.p1 TRINITY_DN193_c2_g1~~TRINITY_DN193_c2_g1_i2.p1  ORF type:complete len:731 (-),score=140.72 TRINITY_DN193_c2_g1_i2:20009-22201(-)